MKKTKIILHLLSFLFFTFLLTYWMFLDDRKTNSEIYAILVIYLLFAIAPLLSVALQYEIGKDKEFFNKFTSNNTENFKMNDYLRVSFLLFYNLGIYIGVKLRKNILNKEYRKTDIKHIEIVDEIISGKRFLLVILIIQLFITTLLFSSFFFIEGT